MQQTQISKTNLYSFTENKIMKVNKPNRAIQAKAFLTVVKQLKDNSNPNQIISYFLLDTELKDYEIPTIRRHIKNVTNCKTIEYKRHLQSQIQELIHAAGQTTRKHAKLAELLTKKQIKEIFIIQGMERYITEIPKLKKQDTHRLFTICERFCEEKKPINLSELSNVHTKAMMDQTMIKIKESIIDQGKDKKQVETKKVTATKPKKIVKIKSKTTLKVTTTQKLLNKIYRRNE